MKFFRLDLLTLLISLFILSSCKNQDNIGLGVDASNQLNGTLIDTSTIATNTVLEDTVISSGQAKTPLAYFEDPVLGTSESSIATDLNLPGGAAYTLPTGTITIDSARLLLHYADGFYGDSSTTNYKVDVYQLNEKLSPVAYYNNKQWNYNSSTVLGSLTFRPFTHTKASVYSIITGKPNTLIKVKPGMRIPINPAFITKNLFGAGASILSANSTFQNNVKGLYITLHKAGASGAGGRIMISSTDTLAVYYHSNDGSAIDTNVVNLPISNLAAQIKHTYSTAVQTELSNTTSSRGIIYLDGLAGLRAKIKFPYLKNILTTVGSDIIVNHAELVITPLPGSNIPFVPLPKLTLYQLDLARQRGIVDLIEDANQNDPRSGGLNVVGQFGGYYNTTRKEYHFTVTAYVQDVLRNKITDYGTYIAPVDTTNLKTVDYLPTVQAGARTIAVGADKTSPYRIKLNIIYTKIAK